MSIKAVAGLRKATQPPFHRHLRRATCGSSVAVTMLLSYARIRIGSCSNLQDARTPQCEIYTLSCDRVEASFYCKAVLDTPFCAQPKTYFTGCRRPRRAISRSSGFQPLSTYTAPQYGHVCSPVSWMGRYTLGWEFQRYMPGIGHDSGRSAAVIS